MFAEYVVLLHKRRRRMAGEVLNNDGVEAGASQLETYRGEKRQEEESDNI